MSYDELNDDLGHAKPPFRVVACIPVLGRLPLLRYTIERLYKKNGLEKVICSGDGLEEKKLCESLGAVWVEVRNNPLGNKWNQAFMKAEEFNPDAVLFVGSSDWLSDNWIHTMGPHIEKHGFVGVPGCYLADVGETIRVVKWPGYKGYREERADESIGIGRMLSRRLLDAIRWQPFDPLLHNSMDRSMKDKAKVVGFIDVIVKDYGLKALSISSNKWVNKHQFAMHWTNMIPSEKIENTEAFIKEFPELNLIFQNGI